jgi:hypothetical protein
MLATRQYADVYHKLVQILNRYYLHKYTFQVDSSEEDAYLNALKIIAPAIYFVSIRMGHVYLIY